MELVWTIVYLVLGSAFIATFILELIDTYTSYTAKVEYRNKHFKRIFDSLMVALVMVVTIALVMAVCWGSFFLLRWIFS